VSNAPQDAGHAAEEEDSALLEITSPMVGTFYRAPAPDAPPYVEQGDRVAEGQTVCILEAMKLMNELEAEVAGTIREICVQNGDPVEYGQVLFRIEPV
jgi:acetyl-CoA carboxylase biotin carboxyl carrier protein